MAATTFPFRVVEHVTPCQHIREYPRATSTTQEETLHLSVKQYIPLDNPSPQPGDVTIIGAHANGFPKELYEPLWEELLARSKSNGFRIRAIWIADAAHQGNSSVLNEHAMGNDPSWFDHPRDLLHLINLKREEMPRPIVGIGHSMGGGHLVALSTIHPRLFTTIILMDPAIQNLKSYISDHTFHTKGTNIPTTTRASTYRRDLWAFALRRRRDPPQKQILPILGPTRLRPLDKRPVTLTTTLHQEVFTFSRPKYSIANLDRETQRLTHPDISLDVPNSHLFYRPESPRMFTFLRYLRPSVFYIFGEKSDMSKPEFCQEKLETTGVGVGGSGGAKEGRVGAYTLKKVGHLIPMEAVKDSAELSATWLGKELERWRREEEILWKQWEGKSKVERMTIDDEWKKHIGPPPLRNGNNKTEKRAPKL
uniref:AB hydrolase-1 domain-containing protein n=1 Tax=Coccidioides posadasii RMSCC 3488 TaxID=454284 RepID=A0A0J6FGW6_COCPO|nr:hypothetical protein CPAG_04441 [Coccidioides posadasii RMSCC 3488]